MRIFRDHKKLWTVLGIVLGGILLLFLSAYLVYHAVLDHYLNKMNIVTGEEDLIFATETLSDEGLPEGILSTEAPILQPEQNGIPDQNQLPLICDTEDVKNILLIGVDSKGNQAGRSDTMILLTVNRKRSRIVLCSFMRDILSTFPSGSMDKLNHAYAYGGADLLMKVMKNTFHLEVERYIRVNLSSFESVVNAMGGLDVDLSLEEVRFINTYEKTEPVLPDRAGVHHLDGKMVIAHVRNRSVGSDHDRTRRQRTVLSLMLKQTASLSLTELNDLLNVCLPLVTTNIPKEEWKEWIGDLPALLDYETVSVALPQGGTYYSGLYHGMWAMQVDLKPNCDFLYETIYGEKPPVS